MTVLIGHSSIDENGNASGGVAGDQTGKEVYTQEWWKHGWTVLLRPTNSTVAEKIAKACEAGCSNNKIGYDQYQRNSLRTQAKKVGFDLSKIATACECDCSSFATVCAEAAGVNMDSAYTSDNAPTTSTMRTKFVSTGQFTALTDSKYLSSHEDLKRGDILVKEGSHTVIVLSNGANIDPQEISDRINHNHLYYRAHIQTYGTLPVVGDGQIAGTIGKSLRLEGFWVDLRTMRNTYPDLKLSGITHIQRTGDVTLSNIEHDTCIGTTGQSLRLEAFLLEITGLPTGMKLKYRSHIQGTGWEDWKEAGEWSGTKNQSKRIEAVQLYVTDEN